MQQPENAAIQKPENVATQKENQYRAPQKPRTAQNSNPENTSKPSRKEKNPEHQPKKH